MTPLNYCILDTLGSHQPLGVDFKLTPVPEEVPEDRQAGVAQPDLLLAALPPPPKKWAQKFLPAGAGAGGWQLRNKDWTAPCEQRSWSSRPQAPRHCTRQSQTAS